MALMLFAHTPIVDKLQPGTVLRKDFFSGGSCRKLHGSGLCGETSL